MKRLLILLLLLIFPLCLGSETIYVIGSGVSAGNGGDALHSDGWESGDFTGWDGGKTDTDSNLSAQGATKRTGSYAMQYEMDTTAAAFCSETLSQNYTEGYTDFYIRFNDVTAVDTASGEFRTLWLRDTGGAEIAKLFALAGVSPYNLDHIQFTGKNDAAGRTWGANTAFAWAANTWHHVRFYWKRSTGAGADNGILRLWIDDMGVVLVERTDIDNDTLNMVGKVNLGSCYHQWLTDQGIYVYFDDWNIYEGTP